MEMKVGDLVWLEARNLTVRGTHKLLSKRYGPYQIEERKGAVAYQFKLSPEMRIHDVFHIDLLLPYKEMEAYGPAYTRPPSDMIKGKEEYEVESIRDVRHKGRSKKREYLVH
jgi:hypothetical protein